MTAFKYCQTQFACLLLGHCKLLNHSTASGILQGKNERKMKPNISYFIHSWGVAVSSGAGLGRALVTYSKWFVKARFKYLKNSETSLQSRHWFVRMNGRHRIVNIDRATKQRAEGSEWVKCEQNKNGFNSTDDGNFSRVTIAFIIHRVSCEHNMFWMISRMNHSFFLLFSWVSVNKKQIF